DRGADELGYARALRRVVLLVTIDCVVELGGGGKHGPPFRVSQRDHFAAGVDPSELTLACPEEDHSTARGGKWVPTGEQHAERQAGVGSVLTCALDVDRRAHRPTTRGSGGGSGHLGSKTRWSTRLRFRHRYHEDSPEAVDPPAHRIHHLGR